MQFSKISLAFYALAGLLLSSSALAAPLKIELSHRLEESQAERLMPLIDGFNQQQKEVELSLVHRVEGDAPKPLNLVTNEEYQRFLSKKAKFMPLHELLRSAKINLDASKFSADLREGFSDAKGKLVALPLAFSTPVLYINKALFKKAGLDPEAPPKTWMDTQAAAAKLADSGNSCVFTLSWPAWVMVDNMSAWNGAPVSKGRILTFNGLPQVKHVAMMATWSKSNYFSYFGRRDEADRRFANGECAMLVSSSALYASLAANKNVDVAVSALPYHDDLRGAPNGTLADGASLWVAAGLKPAELKGVASFVNYVLDPEIQLKLTIAEGFLPMTPVARAAASSKLLKDEAQALHVAYTQLHNKVPMPSLRVSQIEFVRIIVEEELEAVWANKKPAKEALDDAVQRGNAVLRPSAAPKAKAKRGK